MASYLRIFPEEQAFLATVHAVVLGFADALGEDLSHKASSTGALHYLQGDDEPGVGLEMDSFRHRHRAVQCCKNSIPASSIGRGTPREDERVKRDRFKSSLQKPDKVLIATGKVLGFPPSSACCLRLLYSDETSFQVGLQNVRRQQDATSFRSQRFPYSGNAIKRISTRLTAHARWPPWRRSRPLVSTASSSGGLDVAYAFETPNDVRMLYTRGCSPQHHAIPDGKHQTTHRGGGPDVPSKLPGLSE